MRLDVALVSQKFYPTRAKAVAAIAAGLVLINGVPAKKPSQNLGIGDEIVALPLPYISGRGSLKLGHALDQFGVNPTGLTCLDVGASTGGFTEVLLNRGASLVIAVEVGTNQMVAALRDDPRVRLFENTDIRDFTPTHPSSLHSVATIIPHKGAGKNCVDLVVIDVSFIPLADIADSVAAWGAPQIIALIKPQFEASAQVAKKAHGIIKSDEDHQAAIKNAVAAFENLGYKNAGLIQSPIKGGSGNIEFLALFENT